MFLLLFLLLCVFLYALFPNVSTVAFVRALHTSLKTKWFKLHVWYPPNRLYIPYPLVPILDHLLCLDRVEYALNYGDRVHVLRASLCIVQDPDGKLAEAFRESETVGWDRSQEQAWEGESTGPLCKKLSALVKNTVDVTGTIRAMWDRRVGPYADCIVLNDLIFKEDGALRLLYVVYRGHAHVEGRTVVKRAGTYSSVYCSENLWDPSFPPEGKNAYSRADLKSQRVMSAFVGPVDCSDLLRSLSGPRCDFGISSCCRLTLPLLWYAMQCSGFEPGPVEVEDNIDTIITF